MTYLSKITKQFSPSLLRILMVTATLATGATQAAAQQAALSIEVPEPFYEIGQPLTATIRLDAGNGGPSLLGVFINYDPTRLRLESGRTNTTVFENSLLTSDPSSSNEPGVISFSAASLAPLSGDGILVAELDFTALSSGETVLQPLNTPPRETTALDVTGSPLPLDLQPATVTVTPVRNADLFLLPGIQQVTAGDTVQIEVQLDGNDTATRAVQVALAYDPALLQFISGTIDDTNFGSNLLRQEITNPEPGLITFVAGATSDQDGNGIPVASLQFEALSEGNASVEFLRAAPNASTARTASYSTIPTTTSDALVDIGSGTYAQLRYAPSRQTTTVGEPITVDVVLDSVGASAGIVEAFIEFDRSRFVYTGGSINDSRFANQLLNRQPQDLNGTLSFLAASGSAITETDVRVATLEFRSLASGNATFGFRNEAAQQTLVSTLALAPIETRTGTATVALTSAGSSLLRLAPASQAYDFGSPVTVEVRLDQLGTPVREARVLLNFDPTLLTFNNGFVNGATFGDAARTAQPQQTEPGIIALTASSTDTVSGSDILVATLNFTSQQEIGVSPIDFLLRSPAETALLSAGFNSLPLQTQGGAAFVVGDVPLVESFVRNGNSPTASTNLSWTITFSKDVTGVDLGDFQLSSILSPQPTLQLQATSPSVYTITANAAAAAGQLSNVTMRLNDDDSIVDGSGAPLGGEGSGNGDATAPAYFVDYERPVPTLLEVLPAPQPPNITLSIRFNEPVTGLTQQDIVTGGGASLVSLSGSGANYTAVIVTPEVGTVTVDIPEGAATDTVGNSSVAAAQFGRNVDRRPPTVTVLPEDPTLTNGTVAEFFLTFSEPVSGVTPQSFSTVTTGNVQASVTEVLTPPVPGGTYRVIVSAPSGDGTVALSYDPDTSASPIADLFGNSLAAFTSNVYTFDRTPPSATAIRQLPSPTNATALQFIVNASEPLQGADLSNFNLLVDGPTGAAISAVSPDGATIVVDVIVGGGAGTIGLALNPTNPLLDIAGNALTQFTAPQPYLVDLVPPTITVTRLDPTPTSAPTVRYRLTASEPINGLDGALQLAAGSPVGSALVSLDQNGNVYTATLSTGTGDGPLTISLSDPSLVTDMVGNVLGAFAAPSYAIDRSGPTLEVTRVGDSPTSATTLLYNLIANEPLVGVSITAFQIQSSGALTGTIASVVGAGENWQVRVESVTGNGTIGLAIAPGSTIRDEAGNAPTAFGGDVYTIDQTSPAVVAITSLDQATTYSAIVRYAISFSEPVTGVSPEAFQLTTAGAIVGASISSITGMDAAYEAEIATGVNDGTIRLDARPSSLVRDQVGNPMISGFTGGDIYVIEREGLGPTGISTAQIINHLTQESEESLTRNQLDVNRDGRVDAADVIVNRIETSR